MRRLPHGVKPAVSLRITLAWARAGNHAKVAHAAQPFAQPPLYWEGVPVFDAIVWSLGAERPAAHLPHPGFNAILTLHALLHRTAARCDAAQSDDTGPHMAGTRAQDDRDRTGETKMTLDADETAETQDAPASRLPVFDAKMCAEDLEKMMQNAQLAANFLKAISHEGRLMILCHLASGEKSVTELEDLLSARQAAVSQQLSRLRLEGLVTPRRDGKAIYYSLTDDRPRQIIEVVYDLFCRED